MNHQYESSILYQSCQETVNHFQKIKKIISRVKSCQIIWIHLVLMVLGGQHVWHHGGTRQRNSFTGREYDTCLAMASARMSAKFFMNFNIFQHLCHNMFCQSYCQVDWFTTQEDDFEHLQTSNCKLSYLVFHFVRNLTVVLTSCHFGTKTELSEFTVSRLSQTDQTDSRNSSLESELPQNCLRFLRKFNLSTFGYGTSSGTVIVTWRWSLRFGYHWIWWYYLDLRSYPKFLGTKAHCTLLGDLYLFALKRSVSCKRSTITIFKTINTTNVPNSCA